MLGNSKVLCENIKKVEADFSGNERKILVNGKELDLSKLYDMEISISAGIINLRATLSKNELPIKE